MSPLTISSAARYRVITSAHPTMPRVTSKTNKSRRAIYKPDGKKHTTSSGSMLVLARTKTRRGKDVYTKVDPALYYASDQEGESSKRKPSITPSQFTTTVPVSLEDTFQLGASSLEDQEPHAARVTKVRS
jgi:hypothetical protein